MTQIELGPSDMETLLQVPDICIELGALDSLLILYALQLALRHPEFASAAPAVRERTCALALVLAKHVAVTPNLQAVCAAGFRANEDPPPRTRLILPGQ